jgi:hypothetical protein
MMMELLIVAFPGALRARHCEALFSRTSRGGTTDEAHAGAGNKATYSRLNVKIRS